MSEIKVLNDRKRKPFVKAIAVIFGIALIAAGIVFGSALGPIAGLLLVWSAFFTKYTIVNTEGITVHYNAKLFRYQEYWRFSEISNIHRETVKDPDYSALHFTKGALSKRLIFTKKDADKIIEIALKNNHKIYVNKAY